MSNWVYECDIMDFKPSETGYVEVYIKSDCESLERKLSIAVEAYEKVVERWKETGHCPIHIVEEALEKIKGDLKNGDR